MLDTNQIYCGDCLEVMKDIPDKSIDMILCDLPYGMTHNRWDTVLPFEQLWKQYNRIIKNNAAIVLTAQGMFTHKLALSNEKMFRYNLVWEKSKTMGFLNARRMPLVVHEDILVFYNHLPTYNPQMTEGKDYISKHKSNDSGANYGYNKECARRLSGRFPKSILKIPSESDILHPTQKPVALFEYLIKTYSNEGDVVLDNCIGSGTTAEACINTNRQYIGIEKDPEYFKIASERVTNVKNQKIKCLFLL